MKITAFEATGYRCFESVDVAFEPGVTVIHGPNGAGKTTLLEGVLFGLYGARALDDATLADVITRGEDEATLALEFTHGGGHYRIDRDIVRTDARASTRTCVLVEPDGTEVDGARPVRRRIGELLRMDAEAFVNSAYVKQGEINKLLHATPAERQSMIDDLLQLGRLEDYRDRANDARLAVRSLRRERHQRLDELTSQRDTLREGDPYDRLNELETRLTQVREELSTATQTHEDHRNRLGEIETALEEIDERRTERDTLRERRAELQETIEEAASTKQSVQSDLAETREALVEAREAVEAQCDALEIDDPDALAEERATLEERREAIQDDLEGHREAITEHTSDRASATERRDALDTRIEEAESRLEECTSEREEAIERRNELIETRDELDDSIDERAEAIAIDRDEIEGAREAIEDDIEQVESSIQECRESIAARQSHIDQAEDLADADKCPTCGQPVADSPHIETLDDEREALADAQSRLEDLTETREALAEKLSTIEAIENAREERQSIADDLESVTETIDDLDEERDALEAELTSMRAEREELTERIESLADEIDAGRSAIAECNERMQAIRERSAALDELAEAVDRVDDLSDDIDRHEERIDHLETLQAERYDQLDDVDERLEAVIEAIDTDRIERLENEREQLVEAIDEVADRIDDLEGRRDDLTESIGSVRTDIEQLETVESRIEEIESRHEDLAAVQDEAEALGELYESVRAGLRERNVTTLERLLNETFDLLYRNDAYDRIELDSEYALAVYQKDGTELDPSQLSGGERAIFNLSLRCAIYRLLGEGIDGTAPMPPLMLDEPTVFLDAGHVTRLVRLFETMREVGVEQTLVVSHHESLLDAAEHHIAVEKDPTTNRSSARTLATSAHL